VALAGCCASVARTPSTARAGLVEQGRALLQAGRDTVEHAQAPAGIGPEARAWAVRLEAEWARLRWLADVQAPPAAELRALWRQSVELFAGEPFEQARSQARLAAVLRATGATADVAEATALASEVDAIARRLGADALVAEVRPVLSGRHGRPGGVGGASASRPAVAAPTGIASLTDRERSVIELLVEGLSNRQIARQLYISDKTVSVHVSNILAKLGVGSRTEAAAVARRDPDSSRLPHEG
jgi:DNA-binding CsgD family transcriptional regulator